MWYFGALAHTMGDPQAKKQAAEQATREYWDGSGQFSAAVRDYIEACRRLYLA